MNGFVIIDCETGGLDTALHSLLTIGVLLVDEGLNEIARQSWAVQPVGKDYFYTDQALRINGIDLEEHRKIAIPPSLISHDLLCLLERHFGRDKPGLVGFNLKLFDLPFLRRVVPIESLVSYSNVIDLVDVCRFLTPLGLEKGRSGLQKIAASLGLTPDSNAHTCLGDCETTLRLFRHLRDHTCYK